MGRGAAFIVAVCTLAAAGTAGGSALPRADVGGGAGSSNVGPCFALTSATPRAWAAGRRGPRTSPRNPQRAVVRACADTGEGQGESNQLTVRDILREWEEARKLAKGSLKQDSRLPQRPVSLLFVSGRCVRALLAEKLMARLSLEAGLTSSPPAHQGPSDRLLVLSAGLDNKPGAPIDRDVMAAAAELGIDITEDNPCASFDPTDLDMFDLIVCLDGATRDRVLQAAMAAASQDPQSVEAALFIGGITTKESKYASYEAKVLVPGGKRISDDENCPGESGGKVREVPAISGPAEGVSERMSRAIPGLRGACKWTMDVLVDMGL